MRSVGETRATPYALVLSSVITGLEGVDAVHRQGWTSGCEVVLQLSRAEEGRVKHSDVPQQPVHVRS